jgi:hypothetical protein
MGINLQLSGQVLEELISAFGGFAGHLSQACGSIQLGDSYVTGADPLAGQVHAFAGSWHYGLTQLGQHGEECVKMLRHVGATFDQLEQRLTDELKQHEKTS